MTRFCSSVLPVLARSLGAAAAVLLAACGEPAPVVDDAGQPDGPVVGTDAAVDAAIDATIDAAIDAPIDASAASDCSIELPCPTPRANHLTVCGRLYDLESDRPIASSTPGEACNPYAPAAEGPCSLAIHFYDALEYSRDPTAAAPVVPGSLEVDDCGRVVAQDLNQPAFGFLGVVVDDGAGTIDRHRSTAIALLNARAAPARGTRLYVTRETTNQAWSTSAALDGQTFATRGVLAMRFRYQGMPRSGVTVRRSGTLIPADDFYFSDTTAERTTIAPDQLATGANGMALVINSSVTNHDGTGNLPTASCRWPEQLGGTIPGVVFVQPHDAETGSGAPCP